MPSIRHHALAVLVIGLLSGVALAAADFRHEDPIAPIIFGITSLLFLALIGRFVARRFSQPTVLGELMMGILVGNLAHWFNVEYIEVMREGIHVFEIVEKNFAALSLEQASVQILGEKSGAHLQQILASANGYEYVKVAHVADVFSRYGVILLLFLVGLSTCIDDLKHVGGESLRVATIGVIAPFLLGLLAVGLLLPDAGFYVELFAAATLCATSIGITARVMEDLGKIHTAESTIVLGAAVMDDILGLLILAVVSGIVVSGSVQLGAIVSTISLALVYLAAVFMLSPYLLRLMIRALRSFDVKEAKLFVSILFLMLMAWGANLAGLATIVGAFAAGLIIKDAYFVYWPDEPCYHIKNLVAPIEAFLIPLFFMLMGIQVKVEAFASWQVVGVALGLILVAVLGKVVSGMGAGPQHNRLAIGLAMMPRGEVGLIFASIGKSLGVMDDALFSSVILMVIVTTLLTPPALRWRYQDDR